MKKGFLFNTVILVVFISIYSFAQEKNSYPVPTIEQNKTAVQKEIPRSRPMDARPFLERLYKATGFDPSKTTYKGAVLSKVAHNFKENDQYNWYAANFTSNNYYTVTSTCRKVGIHCYIFVEDGIWGSSVDSNGVNSVAEAFDSTTPANPNKGIFATDSSVFGAPPDVDKDPRIIILILDIKDTYKNPGDGYVAGYFSSVNENPGSNSNYAEIYYLDGVQNALTTKAGLQDAMSTTAHEFQHMIHWKYINPATTFFNECFSVTAEIINGYPIYPQTRYSKESNHFLLDWRDITDPNTLTDYSRAARFGLYFLEQFGTQFFGTYLQRRVDGIKGVNGTLAAIGTSRRWDDILPDWFIANYLDDKTVKPEWGYNYPGLIQMVDTKDVKPDVKVNTNVYNYAVQYLSFSNWNNFSINFTDDGNTLLKVKVIKYGGGSPVVEDVPTNTTYSIPDFEASLTKAVFLVYYIETNLSIQNQNVGPFYFSYTPSGTYLNKPYEIAYDESEPQFVYQWAQGDTMAVRFDGVAGMQLDSIRVALRNTLSFDGGVWRAGTSTFLGAKLASFRINGITTPDVPYPVPWTNWVSYDLRSMNIDASSSFVVAFPVRGKYNGANGDFNNVMVTTRPGQDPYHSYTYLISSDASSGQAGWYYISDSDTTIILYLIRAYVSSKVTGVSESVELLPSKFQLNQNYPNPFNPSTIISFNLPRASEVQIKIFDVLGREVRSLINEDRSAGKYKILWDGRDNYGQLVSSGIYFYSIHAGDFFETKKMVLMK